MPIHGEQLKRIMSHWPSGIAVVTSTMHGAYHGFTANSFISVSIHPPIVSISIQNQSRSFQMVNDAGIFGITILSEKQSDISERFAGRTHEIDRFSGLDLFTLVSGVPFIVGGVAFLDCRIIYMYGMPESALFLGEVTAAQETESVKPLVYYHREYFSL